MVVGIIIIVVILIVFTYLFDDILLVLFATRDWHLFQEFEK